VDKSQTLKYLGGKLTLFYFQWGNQQDGMARGGWEGGKNRKGDMGMSPELLSSEFRTAGRMEFRKTKEVYARVRGNWGGCWGHMVKEVAFGAFGGGGCQKGCDLCTREGGGWARRQGNMRTEQ